jgi:HEPN domain-containing protein
MDKNTELRQWLEIADNDLTAAKYLSQYMQPISYEIICFHCQQAVEKYLKWFLVLNNIDPPKIHDLDELVKLCEKIRPDFVSLNKKCIILSEYAVHTRYPDEKKLLKTDMEMAMEYAKDIRDFLSEQFPQDFDR